MHSAPLWQPSEERRSAANLTRFMTRLRAAHGIEVEDYEALHAFSVRSPELFWSAVWDEMDVRAPVRGKADMAGGGHIRDVRFFPEARLNYAENLLCRGNDERPALIFRAEDKVKLMVTWAELNARVARLSRLFAAFGVTAGDRVCAVAPNHPDTIAAFLATNAIGAIWSSCSPDFGERGILDRFGQIAPKLLIACDGYYYNGKTLDIGDKTRAVVAAMASVGHVLIIDLIGEAHAQTRKIPNSLRLADAAAPMSGAPIDFAHLPFDHPIFILYSSGTTGIPKCIVHRAGGILLKHLTELELNTDLKPGDRLFYYSTCGWMMWNWLVSGLAAGATLLLYDGSPFHPDERALFDFADAEAMTVFGTSAKYIDAVKKTGWRPRETHRLTALRTMLLDRLAAGARELRLRLFRRSSRICTWRRFPAAPTSAAVSSPAIPWVPVRRGEIQAPTLGLAVDVFGEDGRPSREGKGELVCTNAFPSMPVGVLERPRRTRNTTRPIFRASTMSGATAISPNGRKTAA